MISQYTTITENSHTGTFWKKTISHIRPDKIDSQFIITARITPNTTASTFIVLEFILISVLIFYKFLNGFH